jgi:hypothetical protein
MNHLTGSLELTDRGHHLLATVVVDQVECNEIKGRIVPGADFHLVRQLFVDWVKSVNSQHFSEVDRLDQEIAELGLRVRAKDGTSFIVGDCHPGENRITLWVTPVSELNGPTQLARTADAVA